MKILLNMKSIIDIFQRIFTLTINPGSKGLSTSVFRKVTFTGVFMNFDGLILESYKTGLIYTLLLHCFTICSDMPSFHLEVDQLRQIF